MNTDETKFEQETCCNNNDDNNYNNNNNNNKFPVWRYRRMFIMQAARKLAIAEVTLESFESRLEAAES